jgi:OHCU decarboxylase
MSGQQATLGSRRLHEFNEMPAQQAVELMLRVCHSRQWAERVVGGRPYPTVEALQQSADEIWIGLSPEDWLEALLAHPRIGETGGRSADWSIAEQSAAARSEPQVKQAIDEGNREYEKRFGHVFLIAAQGRTGEEILAQLRQRMNNDSQTELRVAAEEHRRITRMRIDRLMRR